MIEKVHFHSQTIFLVLDVELCYPLPSSVGTAHDPPRYSFFSNTTCKVAVIGVCPAEPRLFDFYSLVDFIFGRFYGHLDGVP